MWWLPFTAAMALALGCADCDDDFDCEATQRCDTRAGRCEALVCEDSRSCAPGQSCRANRCRTNPPLDAGEAPDAVELPARVGALSPG